ncbi:undecaprenyl-diphosphate phosphatase [Pontibacter sp. 13R65]|uniref:undecaprenyl-diphosphate phosphatase n=1 Tax=Pontibacter sp. 13R65 TaxID=3127458 RepID=UPI00301D3E3C
MSVWQAIILAIVEGLTEFLPVSSTGHMIIAATLMGINELPITKIFAVSIQFGTILSVVVLYWRRFISSFDLYKKILVAFIPAAVLGLLLEKVIDSMLESILITAIMLILGGILLVFIDKWFTHADKDRINYKNAFVIGFFQCIAMIPGVSRSAASIIGGLTQGINRKAAAEFSFFLAVPTMLAAATFKFIRDMLQLEITDILYFDWPKIEHSFSIISSEDIKLLLIGNVIGFLVAMFAIKSFITFLTKYGFRVFGYYRIAVGIAIIMLIAMGIDLKF